MDTAMIRLRRLSRGTVALRDEPGRRRRSSLRKRWFLSFRNGKNMTGSLAKAKAGVGNTSEGVREHAEFQTMIIILLCCHLGEGDREFWVSATEEEDENHLQHGQLLA